MPRKSPYRIILTRQEQKELERRSNKYTLAYFIVARAKMILLAQRDLSNDQIADRLSRDARSSAGGENASSKNAWPAWKTASAPADPGFFPPELVVRVKAIACELPHRFGVPLSRWSVAELGAHVRACGLTASLSDTTVWRWLSEDAIRPWQHRCWIFPRDPHFEAKAGRILDLYQRVWKGRALGPRVRPLRR